MTDPTPSLATPYRTHTCGQLRASDAGSPARLAGWVHRRRDLGHLIFLDLRDRHGITQVVVDRTEQPEAHAVASSVRTEFVVTLAGDVARRLAGTENAKLATGEIELRASEVTILSEALTPPFYGQRARRPDRRIAPPEIPLPRHPARADAAAPAPAQPPRAGHPRGPPRERLRRGRDAAPDQEHTGGRTRLHRPEPAPARRRLRPAAEPAAAEADPHGRGHRPLLPDRTVPSRRGPPWRPPAGVHPARPRDELRGRSGCHGLRRADGHRRVAGDGPGTADPGRRRSRA